MTMLRALGVSVALLVLVLWTGTARAEKSGKELFLEKKCNKCHSIDSEKIAKKEEPAEEGEEAGGEEEKPPDLSGIGKKQNADWLTKWMKKEVKNDDGKKHKGKFKGTDDELKAIVDYLAGLKTGGK